jgi:hypothetical protein
VRFQRVVTFWWIALGNAASIASAIPVSPSAHKIVRHKIKTSCTPR